MVKADLSRDYYGDLGLDPTADPETIKRQFKKLALTYHPDRNPGKESEVIGKFQKIQSANEVLSDPQERAKYDANRLRASGSAFRQTYTGPTASGMRGNPWANAGAGWAPPPKPPPTARKHAPPPSAGAQRYKNFETPKTSASYAAQEGPEARRSTYEAWEHMKNQKSSEGARASPSSRPRRDVPPPPQKPREQGGFRHSARAYEEWSESDQYQPSSSSGMNSPRRAQSSSGTNRKGFMPNTPGGDEPAAPRGAYSGYNKKSTAPPPPPRNSPGGRGRPVPEPPRYPEKADPVFEPRVSTPYATHGGEKLNPFEAANINRSKSTRERSDRYGPNGEIPRSGSDPNMSSPHHRSGSLGGVNRPSTMKTPMQPQESPPTEPNSSSSESGPEMKGPTSTAGRRYAQPKPSSTSNSRNGASVPDPVSKTANSDRPASASSTTNGETMYAFPDNYSTSSRLPPFSSFQSNLPTVLESPSSSNRRFLSTPNIFSTAARATRNNAWSTLFSESILPTTTSPGVATVSTQSLNAFENVQRTLVDHLLCKRETSTRNVKSRFQETREPPRRNTEGSVPVIRRSKQGPSDGYSNCQQQSRIYADDEYRTFNAYCESAAMGSSPEKPKPTFPSPVNTDQTPPLWLPPEVYAEFTNKLNKIRFSFNVDESTFKRTQSHPNGFRANSAENISTKFTPEDWEGKFEAGVDYFRPEQKAANIPGRPRAQSSSRSRGRSPIKVRPVDPIPPPADGRPLESPGGTKFSPEEWAQSFKPQTFAPPPIPVRSNTGSRKPRVAVRPTVGTAAVFDDSDSSVEKRVFAGRKNSTKVPTPPSPDAMDVDTPPTSTKHAFTPPPREPLNLKTDSPQKRPAAPSTTESPTDAEAERLKVNFEDLKIQDLISSLELPSPPKAPLPPPNTLVLTSTHPAYSAYKDAFRVYMCDWDLFNSRFLLHLVARKNQNDGMSARRWEDEELLRIYRMGLKEDGVVLGHLQAAMMGHEEVVTEWKVVSERVTRMEVQAKAEGSGERSRQRMKTH